MRQLRPNSHGYNRGSGHRNIWELLFACIICPYSPCLVSIGAEISPSKLIAVPCLLQINIVCRNHEVLSSTQKPTVQTRGICSYLPFQDDGRVSIRVFLLIRLRYPCEMIAAVVVDCERALRSFYLDRRELTAVMVRALSKSFALGRYISNQRHELNLRGFMGRASHRCHHFVPVRTHRCDDRQLCHIIC